MGVWEEGKGEGSPTVGGEGGVVEVDGSGIGVEVGVLHNGSVLDGVVDFGLDFLLQVDNFGVAAPFDVEDSVVAPTNFIISNNLTVSGSKAQSCLSRCR